MKDPIEFWFDFASPYGYFASNLIDEIAEEYGRTVLWRPFLLGIVMKETGNRPLADQPIKRDYAARDLPRLARYYELPFRMPSTFPIPGVAASRAFYWLERRGGNQAAAKAFTAEAYTGYFGHDRDIGDAAVVAEIAADVAGTSAEEARAGFESTEVKDVLKARTAEARDKGVFGSPYVIVDGEPFWGADRLWMVEEWLDTGGW